MVGIVAFPACGKNKKPASPGPEIIEPDDGVTVSVTQSTITLKDYEVATTNFARFFSINDNGTGISANAYLNESQLSNLKKAEAGVYEISCSYKNHTAKITVNVISSDTVITLSKSSVKIKDTEVANYDFKALFSITVEGLPVEITDEMVTNGVKAEEGEYAYTVRYLGREKTLYVTVVDAYSIEIIKSYSGLELTNDDLAHFDFTTLFSLYVGGEAVQFSIGNIDVSAISNPEVGKSYPVTMNYEANGRKASATVEINVVNETATVINARNIETYPNGENIDLKSLFTITKGSLNIEVTDDMISGTIDYSKSGDNIITLTYGGITKTATVTIRLGVILGYATSDTVQIEKGTDKNSYDFGSDFSVIINGVRFENIPASYFDISDVDFDTEGEYEVKLTIPYNTKSMTSSGINFDYFDITITYAVVSQKVEYTLRAVQQEVILPSGTTEYDLYSNLSIYINGVKRRVWEDKDHQGGTTVYAEIVKGIDFTSSEEQIVEIDVYVFGPYKEPVRASYIVRIDNGVVVTGSEKIVFSGTTVYARELFTITEKGKPVTVTDDMVNGKIDLFHAGMYYVTATYKGVTAQSKAVVLDSSMTGTYKTGLNEIENIEDDDDDYYEYGYGDYDGDYEYYSLNPDSALSYATRLNDFVVDDNGEMYLGSKHIDIVSIVDFQTFNVRYGTNDYVLRYANGIITLDPDTSLKLTYYEDKRPMVYFNRNVWTLDESIQINSSISGYNVLQKDAAGNLLVGGGSFTIDLFRIQSVESGEYFWYGMKTHFLSKYDSNTYYADEVFDFASVPPDFTGAVGVDSTLTLGGVTYSFKMTSSSKAAINKETATVSAFAGTTFKGTVDGVTATFQVDLNDKIIFKIDKETVFSLIANEQRQLKNAGVDYTDNTWLVYNMFLDSENQPYSYKFKLDKENKSFTVLERDDLFGRYEYGNVAFFFDGYGSGEANFDTASKYMTTAFTYVRNGANIEITFRNPQPNFAYGTTVKFFFADLKNVLTVREISGIDLVGKQFVNAIIYDGAIVEVKNFVLGLNSIDSELYAGISIKTKDGKLTEAQMRGTIAGSTKRYVDVSRIGNKPGFYQLIINVPVGGEIKASYYSVQVLGSVYGGNELVASYYHAMINGGSNITVDEYGRVFGNYGGVEFSGIGIISGNSFTATATCATGKMTIIGELIENGILRVISNGALIISDCFTTGTIQTAGTDGYVLRVITVNGNRLCMLATAATSIGNIVEVEGDTDAFGSILKIDDGSKELYFKVTDWGGASSGLVLSDSVRSVYVLEGEEDLVLDGFGEATVGESKGSYVVYGSGVTVTFDTEIKTYRIDIPAKTYTVSDKALDETLFEGLSFSATYSFECENGDEYSLYTATTIFEFKEDGKVVVKSSSADHDEDCTDIYSPEFATESGIEGTFTVDANKITVSVNGKTIVFTFTDAFGLGAITCSQTDVDESSHGYFGTNRQFKSAV